MPMLMRDTERKFQWTVSHASVWRRRWHRFYSTSSLSISTAAAVADPRVTVVVFQWPRRQFVFSILAYFLVEEGLIMAKSWELLWDPQVLPWKCSEHYMQNSESGVKEETKLRSRLLSVCNGGSKRSQSGNAPPPCWSKGLISSCGPLVQPIN